MRTLSRWMTSLSVTAGLLLMAVAALTMEPRPADLSKPAGEMAEAAGAFWKSLTPEQQKVAGFGFDDKERLNWHFIPRDRKGLPIKEMKEDQRKLALALLATGLSKNGYDKATTIMTLESILAEMEGPNRKFPRDPELYYFSIFGAPGPKGAWGWRVEGHHVSVNITVVDGKAIASAPAFLGTNPGLVKEGPRKGLRVLGNDEEMGRTLVKSLTDEQKEVAIISKDAMKDFKEIVLTPEKRVENLTPAGIGWSRLAQPQQEQLWALIREYANRLRGELAEQDLAKIERAGKDKLTFAWAGGLEAGQGHYYRVQGPSFIIEYDNTQNGANHVHSIWHDPASHFGQDLLKKHYEAEHSQK
ncbi:MAG TPA: DUF3500 domain-containing protein [Planctomycetota bacterium]|nr:DUF3500 domain-containing protein [Planctomycetota bacterium]